MVLFLVRSNPRWLPADIWENFEWPYLWNGSSDSLHVVYKAESQKCTYFCQKSTGKSITMHSSYWQLVSRLTTTLVDFDYE